MRYFALMAFLACLLPALAFAAPATPFDYSAFSRIPVQHEGRIKPLDSFARIHLRRFYGHENIDRMNADAWLAEVFFDPAAAMQRPLFYIADAGLKGQLDLPPDQKTFSFTALQGGLQKTAPQIEALVNTDPAALTPAQRQLLTLHDDALAFAALLRSFSLLLPLDIAVPDKYRENIAGNEPTFMALRRIEPRLIEDLRHLIAEKGEDPADYTPQEQDLAALAFRLRAFRLAGESSDEPRLVPDFATQEQNTWSSPWSLMASGKGNPQSAEYLALWKKMAAAYRDRNTAEFSESSRQTKTFARPHVAATKIALEVVYNTVRPFHWAALLYAAALACFVFSIARKIPAAGTLGSWIFTAAVFLHASGLALRMTLLARPPVGTLYESVLFVSLVCALCALIAGFKNSSKILPLAGALTGGTLLLVAPLFVTRGESMEMLVAVLNTNFWLATHVVCVTAGYGFSLFCAAAAHAYLAMRASGKSTTALQPILYKTALAALLLMAFGTALGGIWADQSWGRFWGWDPKENGALLIVLWLIWALHGRLSGCLRALPFAASMAGLSVIVALAWFGVNLLSVGLHSYGFTSGVATGLAVFCTFEALLIGGACIYIRRKERHGQTV
jgi:ABC-type transport system involved in cytochrome c biogenesis permease subunit